MVHFPPSLAATIGLPHFHFIAMDKKCRVPVSMRHLFINPTFTACLLGLALLG